MSNETDPTPLPHEPTGQGPQTPRPPDRPGHASAGDDEVPFDLPDLPDLDLAGLSDSSIPVAEAEPVPEAEGGAVSFNLPDPGDAHGDRTIGVAFADLPDIAGLSPPPAPSSAVGSGGEGTGGVGESLPAVAQSADEVPPAEPLLHVEEVEPVSEFAPVTEIIPIDEPESIDAEVPTAEDQFPEAEAISLEDVDDLPVAEAAPASDVFGDVPTAAAASSSDLFGETPRAEPVSGTGAQAVPTAEPISAAEPADWDAAAELGNLEPLAPLAPGSGWLDSQAGDQPVPAAPAAAGEPEGADAIEAGLAGPAPHPHIEGSDIFAAPSAPAAAADVSDVIAATAFAPAQPTEQPIPAPSSARASDVALTFDQPPGGSTVQDPMAEEGMPVAEEVADAPDSVFDREDLTGLLDSARLAGAPSLPGDQYDADLGAAPPGSVDASSILADLSDPDSSLPGASSAIRLEAPGVGPARTAASDHGSGEPTDWQQQSGSDLFAGAGAGPEFELLPDAGAVDPFTDVADLDQPSLSTAPSSIFSDAKPPAGGHKGSSTVPVEGPDPADAVEFSDHPDLGAADSDSLHITPGSLIDFDLADDAHPERTTRAPLSEDEIDWSMADDAPTASGTASDILSRRRPLAGGGPESTENLPQADANAPAPPKSKKKFPVPPPSGADDQSVVVDWVADSAESEPISAIAFAKSSPKSPTGRPPEPREEQAERTGPTRPHATARPQEGVNRRGVAGLALGLFLGAGVASGVYFSGVLPEKESRAPAGPVAGQGGTAPKTAAVPPAGPGTVADATAALDAGDPARAVKVMEGAGASTPEGKAALGRARFFARVRELAQTNAAAAADDPGLRQARADLESVANDPDATKTPEGEKAAVGATLHLGLAYELAGDPAKARAVYADGLKKFPKAAELFEAALDRVAATAPDAGTTSLRLAPADAEQLAAAAVVLLALADAPAVPPTANEPPEAGLAFWKAVNSAAAGKYAEAAAQIAKAKAAHEKRARALAGRGLNPFTDPLEQIFPKCCDELKAYWELRRSLYEHPAVGPVVKKLGPSKALDQLAAAEKQVVSLTMTAAELKEKNDALATDLKKANEKVVVIEKDLKAEKETAAKLEKEVKAEQDAVVKLEKDLKGAKETAIDLEGKLKKSGDALALAEKGRKDSAAVLDAIAKEFQGVKLLPEKYDPAALVAASKSAAARATGPDLTRLVPPELTAVAGAGLTTGHLLTLAGRVNKAEAAAKTAAADLEKTTTRYQAEIAKLKTDHDAAVKKLTDEYAAEMKKRTDAHETELKAQAAAGKKKLDELNSAHVAELKKLDEKFMGDKKALADAHAKREEALQKEVAAEQARLAAAEKRFRAELGDALSPARSLDLWLPVLVDLRRPADADPALEAAGKTLKTAEPGSEDAAKALTVAGLALLLKGDGPGAREMFEKARATPAYIAGKEKAWAQAADVGAAAVLDPAAVARRPVAGPRKDAVAAARFLDAGITAYKAGRYSDAEKALAEAAWHDPSGAVAWYYLGAARWEAGKSEQAKADFRQGAEREQARVVPARVIDAALAPIQGAARDALDAARP